MGGLLQNLVAVSILGALLTALAFLVAVLRRSPLAGLSLVFVGILEAAAAAALGEGLFVRVSIGPATFYFLDVLALAFLAVVVERVTIRRTPLPAAAWFAAAFLGIAGVSLILGIGEHGLLPAAVQFRKHLYFSVAVLYFATFPSPRLNLSRFIGVWFAMALTLASIAVARWVLPEVVPGLTGAGFLGGPERPIHAAETFIIAQGALLLFAVGHRKVTPAVLMLAVVVAARHRSVWAASAAGLGVLLLGRYERRALLRVGFAASAIAIAIALVSPSLGGRIQEPVLAAATDTRTFQWRLEGWRTSIEDQLPTTRDWLIGRSMGTPWTRSVFGHDVDVSPHDLYVEVLLRMGLLGLTALLGIYLATFRAAFLASSVLSPAAVLAVLGAQLVYSIPYTLDMAQASLLGAIIAVTSPRARGHRPIPASERTPSFW